MFRRAFTLIELLVVISIISLLSSIVLASLNAAREKGRIGALTQFATQVDHVAGEQAVGIWNFDECSGSSALDRSGFNNNGTLTNMATTSWPTDTPSGKGCSLSFNGSNQYVSVPDSSSLRLTGDATYSLWFKPVSLSPTWVDIMDKECGSYGIWLSTTNFAFGTQCGTALALGSPVTTGVWHHVAGVYSSGSLKIYLDGKLAASGAGGGGITSTNPLTIGKGHDGYLNGYIDSVRVFAKDLTASEVGDLYASEAPQRHLGSAIE